jgi:CubicO group peptidase (beta-lactamase class C family)
VQDGNARFLGGLAGHAGLFAAVEDLWRLAREWLEPRVLASAPRLREALAGPGSFGLGWWKRSAGGTAARAFSAGAFGHPGFPGGSVWADPKADRILVLLGHRTSPFSDLAPVRREFHRLGLRQFVARPVSRHTPSSKPQ